ncbi:hypothetical protein KAR91_55095 [Candidatus Pacearchaeota archaeon]|nr:hypothetical protein [Candidatus Pacearchaeota archaeon]
MKLYKFLITPFILIALITLSACSSSTKNNSATAPSTFLESPAEIANALSDEKTAEKGIWSLLNALGVGVYTGTGEQILAGSEASEDDFWLYDFEVPMLTKMTLEDPYPFSDYHKMLSSWGVKKSSEELLKAYHDVYADNSDAFLVQLFGEMGLVFEGDPEITSLQEWLLTLDTFVPPNEKKAQAFLPFIGIAKAETVCAKITSDLQKTAAWGLAQGAVLSLSEVASMVTDAIDPIHAGILQVGVETSLEVSNETTHEKHKDKQHGDYSNPLALTAKAEYVFDLGEVAIECGELAGFEMPPRGPIADMRIDWTVPTDLAPAHGTMRGPDRNFSITFTDNKGETSIDFVPKNEAADGEGPYAQQKITVEADFNIQQALGNFFSWNAMLQEIFNRRSESIEFVASWHEQPGMSFEWLQHTGGGADFIGSVHTCNYPVGPWEGEVEVIGVLDGGSGGSAPINGTGTFSFSFPDDESNNYYIETAIDTSGEISMKGRQIKYNDPLKITFTLNDQTQNIRIIGGSTGKGSSVIPTPMGSFKNPVQPTVYPKIEALVPLEPYLDCSSR